MTGSEIRRGFRLGKLVRDHVRKIGSRSCSENQAPFPVRKLLPDQVRETSFGSRLGKWFKISIGSSDSATRSETISG